MKKLKSKTYRYESNLFIAEGINIAREIISNKPNLVKYVFIREGTSFFIDKNLFECFLVNDIVMDAICETKTPQGVALCVKMEELSLNYNDLDFLVYLDNVSDPGNLGTIIRTADAFGADGVILSPSCVDLYNSKTVRSTMGSMFHINIFYEKEYLKTLKELIDADFVASVGALDASETIFDASLGEKSVICLGNEAHGVSEELLALNVNKVIIPIAGKAESLNVAVAGAVFMYEVMKQRNKK